MRASWLPWRYAQNFATFANVFSTGDSGDFDVIGNEEVYILFFRGAGAETFPALSPRFSCRYGRRCSPKSKSMRCSRADLRSRASSRDARAVASGLALSGGSAGWDAAALNADARSITRR